MSWSCVSMVTFEINRRRSIAIEVTDDSGGDEVSASFLVDRSASDVGNLSTRVTPVLLAQVCLLVHFDAAQISRDRQ